MATYTKEVCEGMAEGHSISRPPLFTGKNYAYWKDRMKIFITSTDYQQWEVIEEGEEPILKEVDGKKVPKQWKEYTAAEKMKVQLYAQAKNILICAVAPKIYNNLTICRTAKEIWDKLECIYEGNDQVKESRVDQLIHEYELFSMKQGEKVEDMFERLSSIINALDALGRKFAEGDVIRKILRSMTPEWESKINAIQEAKDTNKLSFEELRGNLITYEITHLNKSSFVEDRKKIALKASSSSKKQDYDTSSTEEDEEDMGLMVKKFKKWMRKERRDKGKKDKKETPLKCYGCGEVGHIKPKCPKNKDDQKKKRSFKKQQKAYISWEDSEPESETSDEEEAQLCLMDKSEEEQDHSDQEVHSSLDELSHDELLHDFIELYDEYRLLQKKCKTIRKEKEVLKTDFEKLSQNSETLKTDFEKLVLENAALKTENKNLGKKIVVGSHCASCDDLKIQVTKLEADISKFNKPQKDLSKVLDQMHFSKEGIGFNPNQKATKPKVLHSYMYANKRNDNNNKKSGILHVHNAYHRNASSSMNLHKNITNEKNTMHKKHNTLFRNYHAPRHMFNPNVICHYCSRVGHISPVCYTRHRHLSQNDYHTTNNKGPKKIWVPKSLN